MPWWIYSIVIILFSLIGLLTADFPSRIRQNDGKKSPLLDTSNIKFDYEPSSSGMGPTDTDDEDLAGSGSGLSGSGNGIIYDSESKLTPTTLSTTTLNTTTTSRPKSQCEQAYDVAKMVPSFFIPQCLPNGNYAALQCHGLPKTSSCYCSDYNGREIPGTVMEPPNYPDCEKGDNLNPCVFQVVKYFRSRLVGTYYPKCTPDGLFERVQCHENFCFCVHPETGYKVIGSETHSPKSPYCQDESDPDVPLPTTTIAPLPDVKTSEPSNLLPTDDDDDVKDDDDEETINIDTDNNLDKIEDMTTTKKADQEEEMKPDKDENRADTSAEDKIQEQPESESRVEKAASEIMTQPGILAGIIGGSVVVLLCLVLLIMFVVYRMRKKDEGSYPLDEPRKTTNYSYVRAPEKEFYA